MLLRSFSIQLKFPRGQKIQPDFRTEHVQSRHLRNHAEKDERKISSGFSTFLADSREKKLSTNQI